VTKTIHRNDGKYNLYAGKQVYCIKYMISVMELWVSRQRCKTTSGLSFKRVIGEADDEAVDKADYIQSGPEKGAVVENLPHGEAEHPRSSLGESAAVESHTSPTY
jgi:hypothetical protein